VSVCVCVCVCVCVRMSWQWVATWGAWPQAKLDSCLEHGCQCSWHCEL